MKNNQLIVINEDTFVGKIKRFFRNIKMKLFGYKGETTTKENIQEANNQEIIDNNEKRDFITNLKVDSQIKDNKVAKNNFLEEIKGNTEALDMLSTDRLRKLSKYYDEVIENNNKIINKLKKSA